MDLGWLGDLLHGLLHVFSPLKSIAHWKIWVQIYDVYKRLKGWEDWYKKHILSQMQKWQALQHQLFNQFVAPILRIVDLVRRITGVVGIFNRALADRLNLMFLRVEGYLLLPFNKMTARVNSLGAIFRTILTPLGYFDRATLLNSIWRDIGLLATLIRNPLGGTIAKGTSVPPPPIPLRFGYMTDYLQGNSSPIQADVDGSVKYVQTLLELIDR